MHTKKEYMDRKRGGEKKGKKIVLIEVKTEVL